MGQIMHLSDLETIQKSRYITEKGQNIGGHQPNATSPGRKYTSRIYSNQVEGDASPLSGNQCYTLHPSRGYVIASEPHGAFEY